MSNATSKAGAKAEHSIIQEYSIIQQSSIIADVGYNTVVYWGQHHTLFPLPAKFNSVAESCWKDRI